VLVRRQWRWSQGPTGLLALFPPLRQRSAALGLNGQAETSGPEAKGLDRLGLCNKAMVGLWRKIHHMAPRTIPRTWELGIPFCLLHTSRPAPGHRRLVHHLRSLGPPSNRFRPCPQCLGHFHPPSMHHRRIVHRFAIPHLHYPVQYHCI